MTPRTEVGGVRQAGARQARLEGDPARYTPEEAQEWADGIMARDEARGLRWNEGYDRTFDSPDASQGR